MTKRFMFLLAVLPFFGSAQFAPAVGQPGTTAIKKDSSVIVNWATGCKVTRGLQDISNPGGGYATVGDSSKAIGPADGVSVVSLGDGGSAILTFQSPIKNLAGPDFCVFENAFDPGFLELGFVEVSSDGINFTRFAATCNVQNTVQIGPFDTSSDPTKINNLGGKYIAGYGTPFDLQELQGVTGLDINAVTHVKIIDVVGCIQPQYATHDQNNNAINDPWATPYPSSGFDLDAIGVMHEVPLAVEERSAFEKQAVIYPTVIQKEIMITNNTGERLKLKVADIRGREIKSVDVPQEDRGTISLEDLEPGMYLIHISNSKGSASKKVIKIN